MKQILILLSIAFIIQQAYGWGQTGHRVVGEIASTHISKKTSNKIRQILGLETLAEASTYMDFIRSDNNYDYMGPWHFATIPDDENYGGAPSEGDIIKTIDRLISELESGSFNYGDEAFNLKCLIHLIGDIHMPLHIGNGLDRGGNDVKVQYFGQSSNLHRVWDRELIDSQQLSFTEYTSWINHVDEAQKGTWQKSAPLDWALESKKYREQVYDMPENKQLYYEYIFNNIEIVNLRLLQAGIRLAGILDDIYG